MTLVKKNKNKHLFVGGLFIFSCLILVCFAVAQKPSFEIDDTKEPAVVSTAISPVNPNWGTRITISSLVEDSSEIIYVKARVMNPNGFFSPYINLYDDGLRGDGAAGDGTYAGDWTIGHLAGTYKIFITASDVFGHVYNGQTGIFNVICAPSCATAPNCRVAAVANGHETAGTCCGAGEYCYQCDAGFNWNGTNCVAIPPPCAPTCATGPNCLVGAIANSHGIAGTCCGAGESCYQCDVGFNWDGTNCVVACAESWTCTAWSACAGGNQTRTCADSNACGTFVFKPSEIQICVAPVCGDTICNGIEDCNSCAVDCGACPPTCPDATCDVAGGECLSCAADCAVADCCGNGNCDAGVGENSVNCVGDCPVAPVCGDTICNGIEDCNSCPGDCGVCPPTCPDATCDVAGGECATCLADCAVADCCGNGVCDAGVGENSANCVGDCPAAPVCGDGICNGAETNASCPGDCPAGCVESWTCTAWSACAGGNQTRTCADSNACGTVVNKPDESQTCSADPCDGITLISPINNSVFEAGTSVLFEIDAPVLSAQLRIVDFNGNYVYNLNLKKDSDPSQRWKGVSGVGGDYYDNDFIMNVEVLFKTFEYKICTDIGRYRITPSTDCITMVDKGDPVDKLDIVFVADQYTAGSMDTFRTRVNSGKNFFLGLSPIASNADKINIHRVESTVNYGCPGSPSCVYSNFRSVASVCPYDEIVVLVNKSFAPTWGFGGACAYVGSNGPAGFVTAHELGHSAFNLHDEYSFGSSTTYDSYYVNCEDNSSCPKWSGITSTCIKTCGFTNWYKSISGGTMNCCGGTDYGPAANDYIDNYLNNNFN